jgi:hypothetical protein
VVVGRTLSVISNRCGVKQWKPALPTFPRAIPATLAAEYSDAADGLPNVTERLKFVMNYHHNQPIRLSYGDGILTVMAKCLSVGSAPKTSDVIVSACNKGKESLI